MDFPLITPFRITLLFHFIGLVIGFGAAIASDTLFFRFLKDFRISKWEADALRTLSKIVWFGVLLLLLSGTTLFLINPIFYASSSKFLAKMTVVIILTINGARLHFLYAPKLHKIAYTESRAEARKYEPVRRGAFISGGISVSSWISALVLAWVKWTDVPYLGYMGTYILFLLTAVGASLFLEKILQKWAKR